MSEAYTKAGTIGAWLAGFIVIATQSFIAYMAYPWVGVARPKIPMLIPISC